MKASRLLLVGVDGSATSTRALEYALERAAESAVTKLLVLNVQPAMAPSRHLSRAMIDEHRARQAAEDLEAAEKLLQRCKVPAETLVQTGDPAEQIVAMARDRRCKEIIIGNRGHGALARLLLGSVAAKVVQLAPCAVTVVK